MFASQRGTKSLQRTGVFGLVAICAGLAFLNLVVDLEVQGRRMSGLMVLVSYFTSVISRREVSFN